MFGIDMFEDDKVSWQHSNDEHSFGDANKLVQRAALAVAPPRKINIQCLLPMSPVPKTTEHKPIELLFLTSPSMQVTLGRLCTLADYALEYCVPPNKSTVA